jgi:Tol biopolymer transport system component
MTASEKTSLWATFAAAVLLLGLGGCGTSPRIVVVPPQGNIVFTSSRALNGSDAANGASNIWLTDSSGASARALTTLTAASSASPAWSPNGAKIAFESFRALDGSNGAIPAANIWVMNADGSGQTPLTRLTADTITSIHSAWSPDGTKIAYDSTRALDGRNVAVLDVNIWIMNADGTGAMPLTTLKASLASSVFPVWSPDGTKIAFTSSRALNGMDAAIPARNIWVMNADGTGAQPLTTLTVASSVDPAWSPDGTKIAFVSARTLDGKNTGIAGPNIWIMNADGSGQTALTQLTTPYNMTFESPVWSPDGRTIAYVSSRALDGSDAGSLVSNIWTMNANGTSAKAVTALTAASSYQPTWSSDGSKILFCSTRALNGSDATSSYATWNLWLMNTDGTGLTPFTKSTASGADSAGPKWAH